LRWLGSDTVRRRKRLAPLALMIVAVAAGVVSLLQSSESRFAPVARANPVSDLLGWLPATDQSRREYAAWIDQPGAPLSITSAIDRLSFAPPPLALGRSVEWQRLTGISASRINGWASSPGAGATILQGDLAADAIEAQLDLSGFTKTTYRSVSIWLRPDRLDTNRIIEGDDLRALSAIAVYQNRVVIGLSERAVRQVLDTANGNSPSLAGEPIVATTNVTPNLSGIMVLDQRDLAIECGVGRGWLSTDFTEPSGRFLAILYHLDSTDSAPVTSVWAEYGDELGAEAVLPLLEADWRSGYVNQIGFGGLVSNLATVQDVRRIEAYVVADLTAGRDNGWIRSGVRYLISICEQASTLVPSGTPDRATPIASPSPMEST
jgi:hypothetical protein